MITIYVYSKETLLFLYTDTGSSIDNIIEDININNDFTLIPPPDYENVWRWIDTRWVELLPINNPDVPYGEEYLWDEKKGKWVKDVELEAYKHGSEIDQAWENIKSLRHEKMTSGVYVKSVGGHFHTDEASAIQYAQIGTAISLGMFQPLNWKTMEGDFIKLTAEVFLELQEAMIISTQQIYAKAEWHKYMMRMSNNPLEYDYTKGW